MPDQHFKYLGLYSVLLGTLFVMYVLAKYRGDKSMTISLHVASHSSARLLFGLTATLAAILFYPFLWQWFVPTFHLPELFYWCVVIPGICQVLLGWVPDIPGLLNRVHNTAAFLAGACVFPMVIMITRDHVIPVGMRIASLIYLTLALVGVYFYFFVQNMRQYSLIYQIGFYWGFFLLILATAY
jgi:hypothetical protein